MEEKNETLLSGEYAIVVDGREAVDFGTIDFMDSFPHFERAFRALFDELLYPDPELRYWIGIYRNVDILPDSRVVLLARDGKWRIRKKNINRLKRELRIKLFKRLQRCGW